MPKFYCKTPIKLNGERHEEGAPIELTDKQAKALLAQDAVTTEAPAKPEKPKPAGDDKK